MRENNIREVLEKYWDGETSLEEERELRSYFASSQVAEEFAPFIPLFAFFDEEKHKEMSAHITLPREIKTGKVVNFKWLINIAASIVIFISIFFINKNLNRDRVDQYAYNDTYQTPEEAYLEVKQALLFVSAKMNKGVSTVSQSLEKMEPLDEIIN